MAMDGCIECALDAHYSNCIKMQCKINAKLKNEPLQLLFFIYMNEIDESYLVKKSLWEQLWKYDYQGSNPEMH